MISPSEGGRPPLARPEAGLADRPDASTLAVYASGGAGMGSARVDHHVDNEQVQAAGGAEHRQLAPATEQRREGKRIPATQSGVVAAGVVGVGGRANIAYLSFLLTFFYRHSTCPSLTD